MVLCSVFGDSALPELLFGRFVEMQGPQESHAKLGRIEVVQQEVHHMRKGSRVGLDEHALERIEDKLNGIT